MKNSFLRPCDNCGDLVKTTEHRLATGHGRFCSRVCSGKFYQIRHGYSMDPSRIRTYRSWGSMKQRCQNPRHHAYASYGGAGIKVCDEWQSFEGFLKDMGERPDGTSIDRIDGSLGYYPSNCRWATPKEQQSHLKNRRLIEFRGAQYTLAELSEYLGLNKATLQSRIVAGREGEDLATPPDRTKLYKNGQRLK